MAKLKSENIGNGPGHWKNPQKSAMVKEAAVGITTYVCKDGKGFVGVIKHRFRDFMVNEIEQNGKVVELKELYSEEEEKKEKQEDGLSEHQVTEGLKAFEDLVGKQSAVELKQVLVDSGKIKSTSDAEKVKTESESENKEKGTKRVSIVLPAESDKEKRSKVHQLIRQYFGQLLVTDTVNLEPETEGADRKLAVRVVLHSATTSLSSKRKQDESRNNRRDRRGGKRRRGNKKGRDKVEVDWRSAKSHAHNKNSKSDFLMFALYKENVETHYITNKILRFIKDPSCKIFTAGTKDKRAVTVQNLTITKCSPKDVVKAVKIAFQQGNVIVGNFKQAKKNLRLGDLQGNRFTITLRKISVDGCIPFEDNKEGALARKEIEARIKSISDIGYINYFGLQRFGSRAVATHVVGRAVIKSDFKLVSMLIMEKDPRDKDSVALAKEKYLRGDLEGALKDLPMFMTAEQAILKGLIKYGPKSYEQAFKMVPFSLRTLYTHSYQSYVWNSMVSKRIDKYGATEPVVGDLILLPQRKGEQRTSKTSRVRVLNEKDIASGKWTIHDVVMPQPGYDVRYPQHEIGEEMYKGFIEKDNVPWNVMTKKKGDYALSGGYRNIIVQPKGNKCKWITYSDENEELALSDYDILQGKTLDETKSESEPKYLALQITFTLPQSSYATMFMRELMKTQTDLESLKEAGMT